MVSYLNKSIFWAANIEIGLMMTHGYIRPGWVNGFPEVEWRNNPLANCHNMDTLWGFMIQAGEQGRMLVLAELRDLVLWQLLKVWNSTEMALDTITDSPTDGDLRLEGA